jgi:hypothetical protein
VHWRRRYRIGFWLPYGRFQDAKKTQLTILR